MKKLTKITRAERVDAFNEWMRRYTEEPETYEAEFQTVGRFLKQAKRGVPDYGESSEAYIEFIVSEMRAAKKIRK